MLWIQDGKLRAGGRELMNLPAGEWVHFEIAAPLGKANKGTWDMNVTIACETTQKFRGLKNGTDGFDKLTWVGFVSNATKPTVFYVDNLEIVNNR